MLLNNDANYIMQQQIDDNADIGQQNADLIAADLANTAGNNSTVSGTIKYDKIGSLVVIYVDITRSQATTIPVQLNSSALSSTFRPATDQRGAVRSVPTANISVTTGGYINLEPTVSIPSGTAIKGEVAYYV